MVNIRSVNKGIKKIIDGFGRKRILLSLTVVFVSLMLFWGLTWNLSSHQKFEEFDVYKNSLVYYDRDQYLPNLKFVGKWENIDPTQEDEILKFLQVNNKEVDGALLNTLFDNTYDERTKAAISELGFAPIYTQASDEEVHVNVKYDAEKAKDLGIEIINNEWDIKISGLIEPVVSSDITDSLKEDLLKKTIFVNTITENPDDIVDIKIDGMFLRNNKIFTKEDLEIEDYSNNQIKGQDLFVHYTGKCKVRKFFWTKTIETYGTGSVKIYKRGGESVIASLSDVEFGEYNENVVEFKDQYAGKVEYTNVG